MKLGLIGKNIGYSYSKYMHEEMARVSGINLKYNLIDIPDLSKINEIIENYDGLNVTIPYKQEVMKYVDEIDHLAKKIGSVNTIVKRNGKTYGYNTDYEGFLYSINSILDDNMKKALIIGAGGAAKAVYCCLKDKGIETFITNRNERRALEITTNYINKNIAEEKLFDFDIIVNATPVGQDKKALPIGLENLKKKCLIVDLIYNPMYTKLLEKSIEKECLTVNGMSMLAYQGVKAFELFTGLNVSGDVVLKYLNDLIIKKSNIEYLKEMLKQRLSEKRYRHSLGVANVAKDLADNFNLDSNIAYLAGLLHDYGKEVSIEETEKIVLTFDKDEIIEKKDLHVFHGYVGAKLVEENLKINDKRILNAIKYHTFGNANMDDYAKVVYCADYIEPNRPKTLMGVDAARKYALECLDKACLHILQCKQKFVLNNGGFVHNETIEFEKKLKEIIWKK